MGAGPPTTLSPKHLIIAHLVAAGRKDVEIGEIVGMSPNRISIIKKSPLFLQQVRELQSELSERTLDDVAEWMKSEQSATLKRIKELRDQDDSLPVAATVSLALLDRYLPKVTRLEEDRRIHIHIDRRDADEMRRAVQEDETGQVVDAEIVKALPASHPQEARAAMLRSIDDVLADMEEQQG